MATKIGRTGTSSTNATKFTWSAWVKRANIGSSGMLFYNYLDGNNRAYLQYYNDNLYYYDKDGGDVQAELTTAAKYRDPNAFYHICLIGDSTDATQGDRIQLYVNGVRQTMSGTYPDASDSLGMKVHTGTNYHVLGTNSDSTSNPFEGIMSHVHYVDGIDYPATTFGSFDNNTGEWSINTSPSITASDYGNNGYFVLKDGNSVTDQSGNSHNFTVTAGTLTQTADNPSNVFATLNTLDGNQNSHFLFENGNTRLNINGASNKSYARSTLGMSSGKFYFEAKVIAAANHQTVGITDKPSDATDTELGSNSKDYVYRNSDGQKGNANSYSSYGNTYTTNNIIGVAVDLDNLKIYFAKDGTWQNSGDPTSGSTGTGAAYTIAAPSSTSTGFYFFAVGDVTTANNAVWATNFGNGAFENTQLTGTTYQGNGNLGIFKYQPPTGYTALCTKGLNL